MPEPSRSLGLCLSKPHIGHEATTKRNIKPPRRNEPHRPEAGANQPLNRLSVPCAMELRLAERAVELRLEERRQPYILCFVLSLVYENKKLVLQNGRVAAVSQ